MSLTATSGGATRAQSSLWTDARLVTRVDGVIEALRAQGNHGNAAWTRALRRNFVGAVLSTSDAVLAAWFINHAVDAGAPGTACMPSTVLLTEEECVALQCGAGTVVGCVLRLVAFQDVAEGDHEGQACLRACLARHIHDTTAALAREAVRGMPVDAQAPPRALGTLVVTCRSNQGPCPALDGCPPGVPLHTPDQWSVMPVESEVQRLLQADDAVLHGAMPCPWAEQCVQADGVEAQVCCAVVLASGPYGAAV